MAESIGSSPATATVDLHAPWGLFRRCGQTPAPFPRPMHRHWLRIPIGFSAREVQPFKVQGWHLYTSFPSLFISAFLQFLNNKILSMALQTGLARFASDMSWVQQALVLLSLVFGLLAFRVAWLIWWSPLRDVPGPFLAQFTSYWKLRATYAGEFEKVNIELHKKYGTILT